MYRSKCDICAYVGLYMHEETKGLCRIFFYTAFSLILLRQDLRALRTMCWAAILNGPSVAAHFPVLG